MYQNKVSVGAECARATSKFGKLVRFVAGTFAVGTLICGALPEADAQTYNLTSISNITNAGGSNTIINIGGTQRATTGNPGLHTSINVTNTWTINGASNNFANFTINLTNGFTPMPGDEFHIYNADIITGTSTGPGFQPPTGSPRYINYNFPPLSENYYVWQADWSRTHDDPNEVGDVIHEMWFRVEALQNEIGLNITSHGTQHGTAVVTGSGGKYIPGVVTVMPAPGSNDGHISIDGPFPEVGPEGELWVLADLEGFTDLVDFMNNMTLFADSPLIEYELAGESNFEALRAKFGTDWEVLVKFQGLPTGATNTNMKFNWSFDRDSDVTVDRLLVIPEPATMFVCVAALFGMAGYRPRTRRAV